LTDLAIRNEHVDLLGKKEVLIQQINEAITNVASADGDDASEILFNASITEAAAKQGRASEIELAAARLRLHAERRIGELSFARDLPTTHQFKAKELDDFKRLARIPRVWKDKSPVERMDQYFAREMGEPVPPNGKPRIRDLFLCSLDHQLQPRLSHTAYSVYMASIDLSLEPHKKYDWFWSGWDGTWEFYYTDPRTRYTKKKKFAGTIEDALELRAELSGRVSPSSTKLLPVRETDSLSVVLDHIRLARNALDGYWEKLNEQQKRELDGVYGGMDDMARAIVVSLNL